MELKKQHIKIVTPHNVYKTYPRFIERIGRECYQSSNNITSDSYEQFIAMLIKNGHESVLEHANLTFQFITDRATANALVRHRHCAFTQESTHFINYAKREHLTFIEQADIKDFDAWYYSLVTIEEVYFSMKEESTKVRRSLLPLTLKTSLTVTTNIREWRTILKLRTSPYAHPQMRSLMLMLLSWFKEELPIFVEDINAD